MDKQVDPTNVEDVMAKAMANRLVTQSKALGTLDDKFKDAVEGMVQDGELSRLIDITDEEAAVVSSLIGMYRESGYRFRLDRVITRTVNERGSEVKPEESSYELFLTLEHMR